MAFRPKLIPTLFTVPAVITMLFLGFWQVDRLVWKEALIERLHERATGEATDLTPGAKDEEADEFRRVRLSGTFDHENEFLLVNRSLNGNPGMHILTPLTRSDGGGHVLINRGWVPFDKVEIAARAAAQVEGEVLIDGLLRFPKGPGTFTPDNDLERNHWFFIDTAEMSRITGKTMESYYVMAGAAENPGGFPIGQQWTLDVRNNHLQYAITWFSLALALLVIYILYHRKAD